jgi:hypothetical protein
MSSCIVADQTAGGRPGHGAGVVPGHVRPCPHLPAVLLPPLALHFDPLIYIPIFLPSRGAVFVVYTV